MNWLLTFVEGIASFLSPCVLPLIPIYTVYFAAGDTNRSKARMRAIAFVIGFTLVFTLLGVFAGFIGGFLREHATAVRIATGGATIFFGISVFGLFHLPGLRLKPNAKLTGIMSAAAFGMIFPFMILPCAGPFLGAALMHAAKQGGALKGAGLLVVYSAGLGIPLIMTAIFLVTLRRMMTFLRRNMAVINRCAGIILIAIGLFMAFGGSIRGVGGSQDKEVVKMATINVTSVNFESEVLATDIPVILDFSATWCGPCQMLGPVLEELAIERAGKIKVCKVDVDEAPELAAKYFVTSIPAVFHLRRGEVVANTVGYMNKSELVSALKLEGAQ